MAQRRMPRSIVTRVLIGLFTAALLGAAALAGPALPPRAIAQEGTAPAAPVVIANELLGHATPVAVEHPELALSRVTIMPGAVIPIHHHPGTQIGTVVQGVLSYRVYTGEVRWQHGSDPAGSETVIHAGEEAHVPAGDTLIEPPTSLHQGWNDGTTPVVIYLSTLFPAGVSRAILAEATPSP